MAFWKYYSDSTNQTNASAQQFCLGLRDMHGYTAVSSLNSITFNLSNSEVSGTNPTSGHYVSGQLNQSTGNSEWGEAIIKKYHYAKGQTGFAANAYREAVVRQHFTDGIGYTMRTPSTNVGYPGSTDHSWTSTNTANRCRIGTGMASNWNRGFTVINDTTYVTKIHQSAGNNGSTGSYMMCDLEYNAAIDNYSTSGNTESSPQVGLWFFDYGTLGRDPGTHSPYTLYQNITGSTAMMQAQLQWRQQDGNYANSTFDYGTNVYGNGYVGHNYGYSGRGAYVNHGTNNGLMWPPPCQQIGKLDDANGIIYPLLPVYWSPTCNTASTTANRYARLMNVYRTADNLEDGDVITVGSTRYRVLRLHNTGDLGNMVNAKYRACYAFPENNVPFGS